MMSLTFGLFTQVSGSGPLGPLVICIVLLFVLQVKTCCKQHFQLVFHSTCLQGISVL